MTETETSLEAEASGQTEEVIPETTLKESFAPDSKVERTELLDVASQWKVVSDSVTGESHLRVGTVCQDSHHFARFRDDILIGAVADGAGSASKSEIGSHLAVITAVETLERFFERNHLPDEEGDWRTLLLSTLRAAQQAVIEEAEKREAPVRELASTLILFVASKSFVAATQIGDGSLVLLDSEENLTALTTPQSGEYLNETVFLVSPKAIEGAQFVFWVGNVRSLAAFSDGLQLLALKLSDSSPHPPFFAPLFRFLHEAQGMAEAHEQLRSFLTSPKITQRADDDLTLLLAGIS